MNPANPTHIQCHDRAGVAVAEAGTIPLHVAYARAFGINEAILLGYLLRWGAARGWRWRTCEQIERETCLTRTKQQNARQHLVAAGVLAETLEGIPPIVHFRIDVDALARAVIAADPEPAEQERWDEEQARLARERAARLGDEPPFDLQETCKLDAEPQIDLQETCKLAGGSPEDQFAGNLQNNNGKDLRERSTGRNKASPYGDAARAPEIFPPAPISPAPPAPAARAAPRRPAALPADFALTAARFEYATGKGMAGPAAERAFERFRTYWQGSGKPKADWDATWRHWVLTEMERAPRGPAAWAGAARPPTQAEEFLAIAARLRAEP